MTRHYLDAREMEHPLPLERAIAILRELDSDGYLYMLHRKKPVPLLALADEHGLRHLCTRIGEEWHIVITPDPDVSLEELIRPDEASAPGSLER